MACALYNALKIHNGNAAQAEQSAIELKEIPEKCFAVIRFSGTAGEESLKRYNKELDNFLSAKRLTPLSPPTYAFLQSTLDAPLPAPQ
jgi:effector-binding domain-containing protein